MDLQINRDEPSIMHIDLNSCFATVEQQANPLLRGKPIAVAAYTGDSGCIISPSVEAKQVGIKVGFRVIDAKLLYPKIVIVPPDPPKYRAVHQMFCRLFREYSPYVTPLSIDEAVIDFKGSANLKNLVSVGREIKLRMKSGIGEWIRCNIGISTNRFLAKTAASLHKPDGLDVINHQNLRQVLGNLDLMDLCGINVRNKLRLNYAGIYTPLEFLDSDWMKLKKQVFQSIVGYYWHLRLKGYEIDAVDWGRKSFGQSFALHHYTDNMPTLSKFLLKLSEKMGRRLRRNGYYAQGIHVGCVYSDGTYWHHGHKSQVRLYSTKELYSRALKILSSQPEKKKLTHIMVSCFSLQKMTELQLSMFSDEIKTWNVSQASDKINDKYGEFTVTPALMMGMQDEIIDRVPFGGTKDIMQVYFE